MIDKKTKYIKIGDVLKIGNGYAFKSKDFQRTGIPLLRISNIKYDRVQFDNDCIYLPEENLEKYSPFIVNKGDVVIALSGATTGKYGIYTLNEPCLLNQRIGIIKSGESKELHSTYFYYCLGKLKKEILRKAQGAAQPNISTKELGKFKIPLPPLETQKKIAEILDAADTLHQKTKTLIEKYDQLTQSLFLAMFGNLGLNSERWKKACLENCTTKIGSGATPSGGKESYYAKGISLIRSMNVHDGYFKYGSLAFINQEQAKRLNNVIVEKHDVLFNITGASVCRSTIVPDNVLPARVNQHVAILRPNKKIINHQYLNSILISKSIKNKLLGIGSKGGATREAITKKQLAEFEIPLPPLPLQNQFAERVQAIEVQKAKAQASLEKSEELFQSLLQRAFKGEINYF